MPDERWTRLRGALERLDAPAPRRVDGRTNIVARLTGADALSLVALFVAWVSALLFLRGEPNWAVVVMFVAFAFDKLDGYWARRQGIDSAFGRQIDSFIDVFAYLTTGVLLFHVSLSPNLPVSALVGFVILACGGLRLVRHNAEGFGDDDGAAFYHGTTVVHTNLVVVVNYLVATTVPFRWSGWVAALSLLVAAPLMVSDYKAYKTDATHALAGVVVVAAAAWALAIEFGVL